MLKADTFLITLMNKYNIPTVGYSIIDEYKIISSHTFSLHSEIEVSQNSFFQACSLSKCLTAYATLKLVDESILDLNNSLSQQLEAWNLPENKHNDTLNIRQCLSMTSGLCYGKPNASFPGYLPGQSLPTLKNILRGEHPATNHAVKISYSPDSTYSYSGAGYMVLQQLIEDKIKKPFVQYMDEEILPQLNMPHSTFECPLPERKKNNAVPGFDKEGKMLVGGFENIPTSASGGLWSTSSDLALFCLHIINAYLEKSTAVISPSLAFDMLTPKKNSRFGLGFVIDGSDKKTFNFRKNGHNAGYHNELIMFPNIGKGMVVMTNSANGIVLINEFIKFVAHQYHWPSYSPDFNELTTNTVLSNTI